ncbi:MAG: hypothetical protein ACPGU6_08540 [Tenacibaculum sp.]
MKSSVNNLVLERGILTSYYKQEIRSNVRAMRSKSLSRVKRQAIRNNSYACCGMGTFLKVSMFFIAITLIVF